MKKQLKLSLQENKTKHELIHADVIKALKNYKKNSFDLIIADPPYNIITKNQTKLRKNHGLKNMGGSWKIFDEQWDKDGFGDYLKFTLEYLKESKRVLKPEGSIWIFGTYHNIGIVNTCLRLLDIEIINEVIWYKKNAFPNLSNRRLTASHENIIWAHSGNSKKRKYYFNSKYAKEIDNSLDELKVPNKQLRTVWSLSNNKNKNELLCGTYPAQKPLKVLKRMIQISTKPNSLLLSLFSGSGSDACASFETNRNSVSIESDNKAVKHFIKRMKETYEYDIKSKTI